MSLENLQNKRVLVIDDQSEMRSLLKKMVSGHLGVEDQYIDMAINAEKALDRIKTNHYSIIFCDYELGSGKDGQQILEEIRYFRLISFNAAFILVTAAATRDMVMGALEYCPDGYLTKPINANEFKSRIVRVLKNKNDYQEIGRAIDAGEFDVALKACNTLITSKPALAFDIFRIKGKLLLSIGRFDEAKEVYEFVLGVREQPWARLGLAKALFYLKKYEESSAKIIELIKEDRDQSRMECRDWLAKVQEKEGNLELAQQTLEEAVCVSPKAILRQTELGRLATKNKQWDVAYKALRKAVALGRNSCFKLPQNYINLAKSLQVKVAKGGHREKALALAEAIKALKDAKEQYPADAEVQIRASLTEAETYKNAGNTDNAKKAFQMAVKVFKNAEPGTLSNLTKELGDFLAKFAEQEDSIALLNEIKETGLMDADQLAVIEEGSNKASEQKTKEKIDNFNNQGVELFEKGKLKEAIAMFEQAVIEETAGYGVLLNALQTYVVFMQKLGFDSDTDQKCQKFFSRMKSLPSEDPRFSRYEKLIKMYEKIKK